MLACDVLEEVDGDAVPLDDGVFAAGHLSGNSKTQLVFIECEGRFQTGGGQLGGNPGAARHAGTSFERGQSSLWQLMVERTRGAGGWLLLSKDGAAKAEL